MKRVFTFFAVLMSLVSCSTADKSGNNQTGTMDNPTIQTIMSRKSVRSFTDQQMSDEQIETLLRAAMAAPSGSDIRPWSFIVLRDKSRYDEVFTSANFNLRTFKQSSAVFIMCADTTVSRVPRDAEPGTPAVVMPNGTWRDDLGAATQNLLLAAESMGLGAVWTACYPYPDRMNPILASLKLPVNVVPYAVIPVGYPAGETAPKDKWDPSRIHYEKW